ncbi:hypothetical protein [Georgenia muralis]|uniref:Uncharacterized protein n=1 Tax=Georgenia muralis TaxID=154117 RepID=A0A3N4ZU25_9MICO|nr:hypothetical protein [Georgenia muralis]RPF28938.1 hypothetical protein EDD32_3489 [Georgenia muralis]
MWLFVAVAVVVAVVHRTVTLDRRTGATAVLAPSRTVDVAPEPATWGGGPGTA